MASLCLAIADTARMYYQLRNRVHFFGSPSTIARVYVRCFLDSFFIILYLPEENESKILSRTLQDKAKRRDDMVRLDVKNVSSIR